MTPAGYFQQLALNGQCFIGSTAVAGVAIPISTATSQTFGLWNPAGSGVNAVLNKLMIGCTADGTNDFAGLGLLYLTGAGSQIGTGAPIVSLTQVNPVNALLGSGKSSQVRFAPAAIAVTTAGTFAYSLGFTSFEGDIATTALAPVSLYHDFCGGVVVPPGVAIFLGGDEAPGLTTQITLTWAEIPIN
jgi:hypothetical protein